MEILFDCLFACVFGGMIYFSCGALLLLLSVLFCHPLEFVFVVASLNCYLVRFSVCLIVHLSVVCFDWLLLPFIVCLFGCLFAGLSLSLFFIFIGCLFVCLFVSLFFLPLLG